MTDQAEPSPARQSRRRRAWLAALLSLITPGVGQLYNGDIRRAFLCLVGWTTIWILMLAGGALPRGLSLTAMLLAGLIMLGLILAALVDAALRARRIGTVSLRRFQRVWIYVLVIVVTGAVNDAALSERAWRPYSVQSASMVPTLHVGDYFFAERGYFQRHEPQRGDLAVFRWSHDRSIDYVKRVVAVPGDRVRLQAGDLYVNGVRLERQRIGDFADSEFGQIVPEFIEQNADGRRYRVLKETRRRFGDDFPEIVLPPDRFFVLGDNRDQSTDSRDRSVGLVSRQDLTDQPYLIYWSRSWDRVGTLLQ